MSLKAKLEAVIYAAEEPVTLAQLAALFADEALEWKAEQEAAALRRKRRRARRESAVRSLERGPRVPRPGQAGASSAERVKAGTGT